jgi:hypothetical protein
VLLLHLYDRQQRLQRQQQDQQQQQLQEQQVQRQEEQLQQQTLQQLLQDRLLYRRYVRRICMDLAILQQHCPVATFLQDAHEMYGQAAVMREGPRQRLILSFLVGFAFPDEAINEKGFSWLRHSSGIN